MKPRLVLGLGGQLAGDDAVGLLLAERLAQHPDLPDDVQVVIAGADLLRCQHLLAGRRHVLLLDALEALPGETEPLLLDHPADALERRQGHAHHLSAVQALDLLLLTEPELARTRFSWFLVPVHRLAMDPTGEPSPEAARRLPHLLQRLLAALRTS